MVGWTGFPGSLCIFGALQNNKCDTVLALFHNAVVEFGLPERVRSDKGGENVKVSSLR